ncbi:hypothetical protein, partial [Myxosarcina sp. GI1]|uniref:hypothetical protein n=1 Tax=Myxosarcina sp. GI1 TaxID=1541065 RepID=UPI00055D5A9D
EPTGGLLGGISLLGGENVGGQGGFGGGNGTEAVERFLAPDTPARGGDGAGFGGAVFIRSGNLILKDVDFSNNQTQGGGSNADGLGGAIFVLDPSDNTNGNDLGLPETIPTVSVDGVTYTNNLAPDNSGTDTDNNNVYGILNNAPVVTTPIIDQTVAEDSNFNLEVASNFSDA